MNYKQLKILAILCMAFDHVVRIFPLYRMFSPLADRLWSAGHDAAADWLLNGLPFYLMLRPSSSSAWPRVSSTPGTRPATSKESW